jgi:hypothetical protein
MSKHLFVIIAMGAPVMLFPLYAKAELNAMDPRNSFGACSLLEHGKQ